MGDRKMPAHMVDQRFETDCFLVLFVSFVAELRRDEDGNIFFVPIFLSFSVLIAVAAALRSRGGRLAIYALMFWAFTVPAAIRTRPPD